MNTGETHFASNITQSQCWRRHWGWGTLQHRWSISLHSALYSYLDKEVGFRSLVKLSGEKKKMALLVVFARFHGINSANVADFKLSCFNTNFPEYSKSLMYRPFKSCELSKM